MIIREENVNKQAFRVNVLKLYEIVVLTGHYEKNDKDILTEEKLRCISRMVDMGAIWSVGRELTDNMMSTVIDLSFENFSCELKMEVEDLMEEINTMEV